MSGSVVPSDDDLRAFLLGTLADERVDAVRAWLDADASHAARLDALAPRDAITTAFDNCTPSEVSTLESVDRVVRGVSGALRSAPEPADHGGTARQTRSPVDTPAWPPKLGEYRVVREIGRGGMGVVLEIADDTLNRRVAAKVLNPDLAKRPDATARFLREARAVAKVEHDNVVPVLHVGVEAGTPYIVMPLLKGEPLDKRLKREGALPTVEVIRLGREIAAGLGAAHAQGLIHRDMKPANVWLDAGTDRARVLDFGLARHGDGTDALTESGALQGTPAYMAPEQLDGHPADARSDLFALGAILYECATGRRSFLGATVTAILKAVATHDPTPPAALDATVPPDLSALVMKLLAKNPAERFASAAEVDAALKRVSLDLPVGGTATVTWTEPPAPAPPKSRRVVWLAGTALLGLIATGAYFGTRGPRPEGAQEQPRGEPPPAVPPKTASPPARYTGKVEVLVERVADGRPRLLRLNDPGALPLRQSDKFRIEGTVDPPGYLYVVWVDPDRDVTPVYPWNAAQGWGSRAAKEEPVGAVSLPPNRANRYTAPRAKPGVATIVMFARATPLDVPDDAVERWFKELPELALPPGGDGAAVWFDDYTEVKEPARLRTFGEVGSDDALARWQGQLQKAVGGRASFQTAVSFARTGNNK